MRFLPGSEAIIDKVLQMLDCDPTDDLLGWPADAEKSHGMCLSESKMKNEVTQREPRSVTKDGKIEEYSVFSTKMGWHSTSPKWRASQIDDSMGEATSLYFKFLKYYILIFVICSLFSGVAIAVYVTQMKFSMADFSLEKMITLVSPGNLIPQTDITCASATIPTASWRPSPISFQCNNAMLLKSIRVFGLTEQDGGCSGFGMKTKLQTSDTCTFDSMTSRSVVRAKEKLMNEFTKSCVDKSECQLTIEYARVFDYPCKNEIRSRQRQR